MQAAFIEFPFSLLPLVIQKNKPETRCSLAKGTHCSKPNKPWSYSAQNPLVYRGAPHWLFGELQVTFQSLFLPSRCHYPSPCVTPTKKWKQACAHEQPTGTAELPDSRAAPSAASQGARAELGVRPLLGQTDGEAARPDRLLPTQHGP